MQDRPAVDSAYPIHIGDRPATLPHGDSRLDAFGFVSRVPGSPTIVTVVFGGGVGVTDELEIGGQFVPWQVDPRVAFTNPSVYATYSFALNKAVAISPTIQTVYPLKSEDAFIVDVGSSLSLDIGSWGSLSFAPMLSLNTRQGESGSSLSFPLTTFWQASDHITLQLSSGVGFSRFDPRFGLSRRRDALDFNEVDSRDRIADIYGGARLSAPPAGRSDSAVPMAVAVYARAGNTGLPYGRLDGPDPVIVVPPPLKSWRSVSRGGGSIGETGA